jgi:hypothetical protein
MAPLHLELSSLEVEPLEVIVGTSESGQDWSLETLTTEQDESGVAALRSGTPSFAKCCCCCCACQVCA